MCRLWFNTGYTQYTALGRHWIGCEWGQTFIKSRWGRPGIRKGPVGTYDPAAAITAHPKYSAPGVANALTLNYVAVARCRVALFDGKLGLKKISTPLFSAGRSQRDIHVFKHL